MSTAPLLSTLESYLKLTTSREQAISANMANIDTPGYHTRDIDFEGESIRGRRRASATESRRSGSVRTNGASRRQ
jgi:flagellar basal-body rod protein FlgB